MVDQLEIDDIVRHFEDLEDPRSEVNLQHPLISVVVISLMAVLAGAAGPTAIDRWAQLKADELLGSSAEFVGGFNGACGATVGFSEAWLGRSMVGKRKAALAA